MATRKGTDGKVGLERPYLRDAFAYEFTDDPARGHWRRLADLPYPVAGSPSPAVYFDQQDRIFVLGGLIGDDENIPPDDYPPFPRHVTAYAIGLDRWTEWSEPLPASCARGDAAVIPWHGGWVMPAGETLPGKRSAEVDFLWLSPR
jgi:hypothetical protein